MVVKVEVCCIEVSVVENHKYLVVVVELSEIASMLVVVQSLNILVEPHLAAAQRRVSVALQGDACNGHLRQQSSCRAASLDAYLAEILVHEEFLAECRRLQSHLYHLCLAVRVGCEINHLAARCALRGVVFALAGYRRDGESLDVIGSRLAVSIHHIIYGTVVAALEYADVDNVLTHENLLCHLHHLELSVAIEQYHVVDVGAVAHELVLLQARSDESFGAVDVEFLVGLCHLRRLDGVEVAYLGAAWEVFPVFVLDVGEPVDGHIGHVCQVVSNLFQLCLDASHQFVSLVFAELQYALHLYLQQTQDVVACHLAYKLRLERLQPLVDVSHNLIEILCRLKPFVLVDALLYEYLLKRGEEQLFLKFAATYLEFLAQKCHRAVDRMAKHIANGKETGLVVLYDAAVGRQAYLAIGEGVERVYCLVARHTRCQMHLNLHLCGGQVFHLARLYLASLDGFHYRVLQCLGCLGERYLADDERLLVEFLYLGAHLDRASALAVVIFRHVYASACWEVGIEHEVLSAKITYRGVAQFVEVMWQNL